MEKKQPIHKLRDGRLSAAVWENQTKDGKTVASVTFTRTYRTESGLRNSGSFGRSDLLALAKLATEAHSFLLERAKTVPAVEPQEEAAA